jgi:TP901 family phage tail tape measure protein
MPPGIRLEITVDDKGTPVLRQFASTAQQVEDKLGTGVAEGAQRATRATDSLTTSIRGAISQGVGIAAGFTGFQAVASLISAAGSAITSFQDGLTRANTLIPGQTALQKQLREEVQRLPAALGTSAELAQGLYAVLSTGIKPAEAVGFLATSAELAKAGFAELDTATLAISKSLQVYGFETRRAGEVSDILFNTVNLGQGTLQEFAGALPNVLVISKALGVSFTDASAGLATLSNAFKSPAEAATGLRSLFAQLTANADEFAIRGVNIREVIREKGLLGALDALRTLTQGNAEAFRQFIPDIEGQQAALTLTGAQYEKFIENQQKLSNSQGSVRKAFQETTLTVGSALSALTGEFGRYAQAFESAIGSPSRFVSSALQGTANLIKSARESLEVRRTQAQAEEAFEESINQSTLAVQRHGVALTDQFGKAKENIRVTEDFAKALDTERTNVRAAEAAIKNFGEKSQAELERLAGAAELNFAQIFEHGKETPQNLLKLWEKSTAAIIAAYGQLTPGLRLLDKDLRDQAARTAISIEEAYKRFSIVTTEELQRVATRSIAAFQEILKEGKAPPEELLKIWQRILDEISKAGFKTLPPGFQQITAQMQEIARKAGVELPKPFLDAFNKINVSGSKVTDGFKQGLNELSKLLDVGGKALPGFEDQARKLQERLGLVRKTTDEVEEAAKRAGDTGEKQFNKYGQAVARASKETQRLLDLKIQVETPFADDLEGLRKQFLDTQKLIADIANGIFLPGLSLEGREALLKRYREILAEIQARLTLIEGQTDTITGTTGTPTLTSPTVSVPTGGGAPGLLPGRPGVPPLLITPGPLLPTLPPIVGPPNPPGFIPLVPLGGRVPGPFGGSGGGVGAAGGGSSTTVLPDDGRFRTPPPERGGGAPERGGLLTNTPTLTGVTLNINVSTAALTRGAAQDLAAYLAPALRELQRRGEI